MAGKSRRRAIAVTTAAAVVVLLGVGAYVAIDHGRGTAEAAAPPPAVTTVAVAKTDLSNTRTFTGTLGFGTPEPLKGAGAGVVTQLPDLGSVAQRGKPLYSVNGVPVPVFFGDTPLFRKLDNPDLTGPDVATVADNLARLGYSVGTRAKDPQKAKFTFAAALKKWEKKAGLPDTGTLDVGQVVVLPGEARVNSVTAQLGDPAAGPLLTTTPTAKVVVAPVDAAEVGSVKAGMAVTMVRPDGKEIPAKVSSVSTAVTGGDASGGDQSVQGPPKINVTVVPVNAADVGDLDSASVQVKVATETHAGVLAVPLGALVALREGGYAVQLQGGKLVPVKTGMFARDQVEISGPGITEGLRVVTTS
ncbi:HlyD family secretion protein [Amycolatopsis rhabdoformis]|uniref:HlyD family secretion protein n=1 Tax=Amycolatopsis rhabdoformis TaxID=1448059 RepID=A0ABZ1HX31_9PSEU|nr:HlyD family secretion protein [Amycolatopsis rhabdoformis]WSE26700.1 HlyD family secretion protein [Amycolatopsis rhabdoformis]